MQQVNLSNIEKITAIDFVKNEWCVYKKAIKIFGITIRMEGVYCSVFQSQRYDSVPKNNVIIEGVVYKKPSVILEFTSGKCKQIHFDTLEQAKAYADDLTFNKANFIRL